MPGKYQWVFNYLEPSIGNHNDEFLEKWYAKLDECSMIFMDMVINFCDKTLTDVNTEKVKVRETLQHSLKTEDYKQIIETINDNETSTTQTLKRRKAKRFNHLLYKNKTATQDTQQRYSSKQNELSYADITKKRSQTNLIDNSSNNTLKDININWKGKRINARDNPTWDRNKRTLSNTDLSDHEGPGKKSAQNEIKALREEIHLLKQQNNGNFLSPIHTSIARKEENHNPFRQHLLDNKSDSTKNSQVASGSHRGQEILNTSDMLKFIETTMQTLNNFAKQLKEPPDSTVTQRVM